MNPKEFFEKVVKLRNIQKEYFRTRDISILKKSKDIEKEIDNEISRVSDIQNSPNQLDLFNNNK